MISAPVEAQSVTTLTAASGTWTSDTQTFKVCLQAAGGDGGNATTNSGTALAGRGSSGDFGCAVVTAPVGTVFSFTNDTKSAPVSSSSGGNGNAGGSTTFTGSPSGAPAISLTVNGGAGGAGISSNGGVPGGGMPTRRRAYFTLTSNLAPSDDNGLPQGQPGFSPSPPIAGNGSPGLGYGWGGGLAYATAASPGPYTGGLGAPGAIIIYR